MFPQYCPNEASRGAAMPVRKRPPAACDVGGVHYLGDQGLEFRAVLGGPGDLLSPAFMGALYCFCSLQTCIGCISGLSTKG